MGNSYFMDVSATTASDTRVTNSWPLVETFSKAVHRILQNLKLPYLLKYVSVMLSDWVHFLQNLPLKRLISFAKYRSNFDLICFCKITRNDIHEITHSVLFGSYILKVSNRFVVDRTTLLC